MVFPVVMYGCESWTVKKAECWRIDAFELWCWRRFFRVPWTTRRSNQSILKEISPGISFFFCFLAQKEFFVFFNSKNHLLCCKYRSQCTFCHLRGKNVWISEGTYLWLVSMIVQSSLSCLPKRDQPWDFFGRNDAKAETPVLWPPHAKSWLIGKDSDAGRDWGQEEKGMTEDEMAGWHHWFDGHESEWTPGVGDGQGGLTCCNSRSCKESDTTEWLIWSDLIWMQNADGVCRWPFY